MDGCSLSVVWDELFVLEGYGAGCPAGWRQM
jgi:hypothetical protein